MSDLNIALYIEGTRIRHGGMSYILSVGGLAGNENEGEIDMPPISRNITQENPVITLKNAESYVYYKLWDSSIAPSDDENNPGRLAICMTMPSNARMRDNKSPYNLLMDIYHKFLELGTVQINENQRVFLNVDLDKGDFVKIIEQYPLETISIKVEAMRGTTIAEIQMPQEKMEEFFRDAQYPEFVGYKAVEVTTSGKNMFPTLQIPREPSYEIFINGNGTGKFIKDRTEPIDAYIPPTDDVKYDRMRSSLEELTRLSDHTKRNHDNTVVIHLDENRRRIDCTLTPRYITYQKKLVYTSDTNRGAEDFVKEGLSNNTIRLMLDGEEWSYAVKPSVAIAAKKNNTIDIYPHTIDNYELSVDRVRIDTVEEQVIVHIRAIRKHQHSDEEDSKPEDSRSNRKFWRGFAIGIAIGLILGIGGLHVWQYYQNKKATEADNNKLKEKENAEYMEVIKLPMRNPKINVLEDQEEKYLTFLQSNEGAKPYRNYLKEYSKDNTVCYKQEHVTEVNKRLFEFVNDSTEYAEFLANETMHKAANDALIQIQVEIGKNKPNYDKVIELCDKYDAEFDNVSTENTSKVADIRSKAKQKKQEGQQANMEIERIENEALAYLNKRDFSGFTKWKDKDKLDKHKRNAIAWILDCKTAVKNENTLKDSDARKQGQYQEDVKKEVDNYLKEIGFKDRNLTFKNWKEVMTVKTKIDEIILKKGKIE